MIDNCKECNGAGVTVKFDKTHEIFVREDCITCALEERYKEQLFKRLSSSLTKASVERLAKTLAGLVIEISSDDVLDRLDGYSKSKEYDNMFALISVIGEMKK